MIRPTSNRVLLEPVVLKQATTESGILLPEKQTNQAKVVAVGPDVVEVTVGDMVLYDRKHTKAVMEYLLIPEDLLLAIVTPNEVD